VAACSRPLAAHDVRSGEEQARSIEIRSAIGEHAERTIVGFPSSIGARGGAGVLALLSRKQPRGIRKAEQEGVGALIGSRREDVEIIYRLHPATRGRQGVPIQPRLLFDGLWERVISSGLSTIFVAEIEGLTAAPAIFIGW
jgi:hypothetical protein